MDPNATLARMRGLFTAFNMDDEEANDNFDMVEFMELWEAMDGWLTRGGSFPTEWHPLS